jgi:GNAT superfamily N-acetyltransferase
MPRPDIREMTTEADIEIARTMLRSYVQWLFDTFPEEIEDVGSYYSPERLQQALEDVATEFVPPRGIALIAGMADGPVGIVFAHPIGPGIAEMKRLFVLPAARGRGAGQALIAALIDRMEAWGHATIRLDTAVFLTEAIALYRRMGFVEIEPYTEVPAGAVKTALFFERKSQSPAK